MKLQIEKMSVAKLLVVIFAFALFAGSFGCDSSVPTTTTNANSAVKDNNNVVAVNNAAPSNKSETTISKEDTPSKTPVTLPVLDAMFSDENFAGELKSKLQFTDEQIQNLKNLARQSTAELSENRNENSALSTRAATERAESKIREMLGEEKTAKLFDFVRERWANGNDTANNSDANSNTSKQPNSIPTDTRIVVNAPAYRMDIFQEGKLVKTYKIGIGYPEFPLPSGMRQANEIIFNPTWTPPDEPWVKGKIKAGKTIEAGSSQNPLGPIKIPIGSPSLIHGGKAAAKLGGFASHGCVGLTNPLVQEFAVDLAKISGLSLTAEDVKNYAKQKDKTKYVKLNNSIPVELRYETIVVENGKLKIYRDVYERGTNTEENLRNVLQAYGVSLDSLPERETIIDGLKQMAFDAMGNPINAKDDSNKPTSKNSKSNNGSVTRNIKGKKELSFDIAALNGKGYPAPLGMNNQVK